MTKFASTTASKVCYPLDATKRWKIIREIRDKVGLAFNPKRKEKKIR